MDISDFYWFKGIPVPGIKYDIFEDDEEHRGHSFYIGNGSNIKGDYWNCYCNPRRGGKPPYTLEEFLEWVDNKEDVMKWRENITSMLSCVFVGAAKGQNLM